jgi:hypothetical protein
MSARELPGRPLVQFAVAAADRELDAVELDELRRLARRRRVAEPGPGAQLRFVCAACGCTVADADRHGLWHEQVAQLARDVAELQARAELSS